MTTRTSRCTLAWSCLAALALLGSSAEANSLLKATDAVYNSILQGDSFATVDFCEEAGSLCSFLRIISEPETERAQLLKADACKTDNRRGVLEYRLSFMAAYSKDPCLQDNGNTEPIVAARACYGRKPCWKTGVYIGTFDPFHRTHYEEAKAAQQQLGLDSVLIIPNSTSSGKRGIAPLAERINMINMYFKTPDERKRFKAVALDPGTYGEQSKELYFLSRFFLPEQSIVFIMGSDVFADLQTWKDARLLLRWSNIIVNSRANAPKNLQIATPQLPSGEFSIVGNVIAHRSGHGVFFEDFQLKDRGSFAIKLRLVKARAVCASKNWDLADIRCEGLIVAALQDDLDADVVRTILRQELYPDELIKQIAREIDLQKKASPKPQSPQGS